MMWHCRDLFRLWLEAHPSRAVVRFTYRNPLRVLQPILFCASAPGNNNGSVDPSVRLVSSAPVTGETFKRVSCLPQESRSACTNAVNQVCRRRSIYGAAAVGRL